MWSVNLRNERIGQINKNAFGSIMKVVDYKNNKDILVEFEKGNKSQTSWVNFINGKVQNPYDKSVIGVGYLGEGKCKACENEKFTPQYVAWRSMLNRCYSEKFLINNPTYSGCITSEEWHNFQNFAKWYDDNYYEVEGEKMNLDKDILIKGNKMYSPETCVFVPRRINMLFVKSDGNRGLLPIGVMWDKRDKKYLIRIPVYENGKIVCKTKCNRENPEKSFQIYKEYKEKAIKEMANYYREKIPTELYNAMIDYTVEITD